MRVKTCSKCKETKPRSDFYKRATRADGLGGHCKECCNKYMAAYIVKHREKLNAYSKLWSAQNREKRAAICRVYRAKNRDEIVAKIRAWRVKNRDRCAQNKRKATAELSNAYVVQVLTKSSKIPAYEIHPVMIKAKRAHLRLLRLLKGDRA